MREIKYRAVINKDIYYPEIFSFDSRGISFQCELGYVSTDKFDQYTGRKDSEGVEIYEGDIVNMSYYHYSSEYTGYDDDEGSYIGKIMFYPSKGFVLTKARKISGIDCKTHKVKHAMQISAYRCKIIGNIHKNPELLEPTND